jgi:hypothetical protein
MSSQHGFLRGARRRMGSAGAREEARTLLVLRLETRSSY